MAMLYGKKEHFDSIHESLIPCVSVPTPEKKWMYFPEMDRLIANAYNRVCINLTRYGLSKTFFPLQSGSSQNPN